MINEPVVFSVPPVVHDALTQKGTKDFNHHFLIISIIPTNSIDLKNDFQCGSRPHKIILAKNQNVNCYILKENF